MNDIVSVSMRCDATCCAVMQQWYGMASDLMVSDGSMTSCSMSL